MARKGRTAEYRKYVRKLGEGDNVLAGNDILQVTLSVTESVATDSADGLTSVL